MDLFHTCGDYDRRHAFLVVDVCVAATQRSPKVGIKTKRSARADGYLHYFRVFRDMVSAIVAVVVYEDLRSPLPRCLFELEHHMSNLLVKLLNAGAPGLASQLHERAHYIDGGASLN